MSNVDQLTITITHEAAAVAGLSDPMQVAWLKLNDVLDLIERHNFEARIEHRALVIRVAKPPSDGAMAEFQSTIGSGL